MTIAHLSLVVLAWVLSTNGIAKGIFHCLVAKHKCLEDDTCAALLDVVANTCGDTYDGSVCRSLSLDTCRGALQTVWTNDIFKGECMCTDEDEECQDVRNSLSQHPCLKVPRREPTGENMDIANDYPSCNYASKMCSDNGKCRRKFEMFRKICKIKDGECRMTNWVKCQRAWTQIQLTPIYGCLCHGEYEPDKCAKIFNFIYNNPCVAQFDTWHMSWTSTESSTESGDEWPPMPGELGAGEQVITPFLGLPDETGALHYPVLGHRSHESFYVEDSAEIFGPFVSALHGGLVGQASDLKLENEIFNPTAAEPSREPPMTGSPSSSLATTSIKAKSTCQNAYKECLKDNTCLVLLGNMLQACELEGTPCNRTECLSHVYNFYQLLNKTIVTSIAFCICKYQDSECLLHQRKLHPPCAQQSEVETPGCHEVANQCRVNLKCREKMERFATACEIDRNTYQCKGSLEECRSALVGILGTHLRTSCACSGNDIKVLYYCIEWQTRVWLNPCVVQAQKDYLENSMEPLSSQVPPTKTRVPPVRSPIPPLTIATSTEQPGSEPPKVIVTYSTEFATATDSTEYCVIPSKDQMHDVRIAVNGARRIYDRDSNSCSVVCFCDSGRTVSCNDLGCLNYDKTCQSDNALYHHTFRTYVAAQGHCKCYLGVFICMKPPKTDYVDNPGVYLYLGYSKVEEENVKNKTQIGIADAVLDIQKMADNYWGMAAEELANPKIASCKLLQSNQIGQNVIMQAYLQEFDLIRLNNSITTDMVKKENELCFPALKNISDLIMMEDSPLQYHVAMSIIKMSTVETIYKEPTGHAEIVQPPRCLLTIWCLALVLALWGCDALPVGLPP